VSGVIGAAGARAFVSYSHEDRKSVDPLLLALKPAAKRALGVSVWNDSEITAGIQWARETELAIQQADVVILCMSPAYLGSKYLYYQELPAIRERGDTSRALVVPVILQACAWWGFVGDFHVVPTRDGRVLPISEWPSPKAGYQAATVQIVDAIRTHFHSTVTKDEILPPAGIRMTPRLGRAAPSGPHRLSPEEIDRAVGAVVAARAAKSGA
jgi:hypothetical protein